MIKGRLIETGWEVPIGTPATTSYLIRSTADYCHQARFEVWPMPGLKPLAGSSVR